MAQTPPSTFVPIKVEDLKVGMHVKLDCHWLKHPFPRNTFKVQSSAELAAIRKLGHVTIYVDPTRSDPESLTKSTASEVASTVHQCHTQAQPILVEESEEERSLRIKKEERIQAFLRCQEQAKKATAGYADALSQTKEVIGQISAVREGCISKAIQMTDRVTDALQGQGTAMAILNVDNSEAFGASNFAALHSLNVFMLSMMIGRGFELSRENMRDLGIGALLHDIGERKVPSQVLAKQRERAPLTRSEKTFFELHPEYGQRIIEDICSFPPASAQVVYQHHERIDGSGYPCGLKDDAISFLAKIVMVADEYDHLTSIRDPSKRLCPTEAFAHLYANRGKAFSENVIVCLIQALSIYPPGTFVLMSDESLGIGMVISTNFAATTRPMVMIYEPDTSVDNVVVLNLAEDEDICIQKILHRTKVPEKVQNYWNPRRMAGYFVQIKDHQDDPMNKR
ncbi:MAG: DUF3391 domain-containing protein [Nitrospira defluvii]|nr:DUF3391 domain-containing protein [Nitrospira defluvii]